MRLMVTKKRLHEKNISSADKIKQIWKLYMSAWSLALRFDITGYQNFGPKLHEVPWNLRNYVHTGQVTLIKCTVKSKACTRSYFYVISHLPWWALWILKQGSWLVFTKNLHSFHWNCALFLSIVCPLFCLKQNQKFYDAYTISYNRYPDALTGGVGVGKANVHSFRPNFLHYWVMAG